jgi:hypothetical protein
MLDAYSWRRLTAGYGFVLVLSLLAGVPIWLLYFGFIAGPIAFSVWAYRRPRLRRAIQLNDSDDQ